jgi:hypothetical protein
LFDAIASRLRVSITPGAMAGLPLFLRERIDEDEYLVREYWDSAVVSGFGAPFDLERYLYDFAGKRMIVALHSPRTGPSSGEPAAGMRPVFCAHDGAPYPCLTMRALALPYAGHPEFRDEWRA